MLITLSSLCGHMAQWVCRQHPYGSVGGVEEVNAWMIDMASRWQPRDCPMREFGSRLELWQWLEKNLYAHPQMKIWNTPKSGHDREIVGSSRFWSPSPDDDFIDIDALLRNVGNSAWQEAEEIDSFDPTRLETRENREGVENV